MRRWNSAWGGGMVLVAMLALIAMTAAPVMAQDGGPGGRRGGRGGGRMGGMFGRQLQPEFLRRDLPRFVSELQLDDAQSTIVEAMLLEYEAEFSAGAETVREQMEENRRGAPEREAERTEVRRQFREIRDEIRALRESTPEGEELDPDQMAEIRELMSGLRAKAMEMRPSSEEIQESIEQMRPLMDGWERDSSAMARAFVNDTKALLNEEQLDLWDPFERTLRREKTLPRGQLSGERVDLYRVLRDDVELDAEALAALDPLLVEYSIDLDNALVAREEQLAESRDQLADAMMAQDMDRASALMDRDTAARIAVRSVNERSAESVALTIAEIGEEADAARFLEAWNAAAYPRIYRPRSMERAFETALAFEDLSDETLVAIVALEEGFLADLAVKNERLVVVTRAEEPARSQRWMRRRAAFMAGGGNRGGFGRPDGEEDPIGEQFEARSEMEKAYRKRLESLLTPEQIALLPEVPQEREGRAGRGRGRDGGDRERGRDRDGENDADREAARARMLKRYDKDGDGELSDAERQTMREQRRNDRSRGGGEGRDVG